MLLSTRTIDWRGCVYTKPFIFWFTSSSVSPFTFNGGIQLVLYCRFGLHSLLFAVYTPVDVPSLCGWYATCNYEARDPRLWTLEKRRWKASCMSWNINGSSGSSSMCWIHGRGGNSMFRLVSENASRLKYREPYYTYKNTRCFSLLSQLSTSFRFNLTHIFIYKKTGTQCVFWLATICVRNSDWPMFFFSGEERVIYAPKILFIPFTTLKRPEKLLLCCEFHR